MPELIQIESNGLLTNVLVGLQTLLIIQHLQVITYWPNISVHLFQVFRLIAVVRRFDMQSSDVAYQSIHLSTAWQNYYDALLHFPVYCLYCLVTSRAG